MNKELLSKNLQIIKSLPPGETCQLDAEGAGVLQAFVKARSQQNGITPAEKALHKKIMTVLSTWNNGTQSRTPQVSPQKRTQLVLREAIDKVKQQQFQAITEEEIKLLRGTYEVFAKRNLAENDPNARLMTLLKSTLDTLDEHQAELKGIGDSSLFDTLEPTEGAEQPDEIKNELMADEAFTDIQTTQLRNVEDIELDINVRIFEFEGNTVISGDIPNDVLVKVTDGSATLNGFVSGYIAADGDVTVNGNIQGGGLISNHGSIKLERSLMGAALIAKRGNITCDHLESPEWAFAWDTITVNGPCMAGVATAGSMKIQGKVMAAELRSCGKVEIESLETSSRSQTYSASQRSDHLRRLQPKNGRHSEGTV